MTTWRSCFGGVVATLVLPVWVSDALAAERPYCSVEMSAKAEYSLSTSRHDWLSLWSHWRAFVACDDGAVAAAYSDAVVVLFSRDWSNFHSFYTIVKRDPDFKRWVIQHIDASTSTADLKQVVKNTYDCGVDQQNLSLCKSIRLAALAALDEYARSQSLPTGSFPWQVIVRK